MSKNKKQLEQDIQALEQELKNTKESLQNEIDSLNMQLSEKETSRLYAISKWSEYSKRLSVLKAELSNMKEKPAHMPGINTIASRAISKFILNIKSICLAVIKNLRG